MSRDVSRLLFVLFIVGIFILWQFYGKRSSFKDYNLQDTPDCTHSDKNMSEDMTEDFYPDPNTIRLLCWNIEGLENKRTLLPRTLCVCNIINRRQPHVVFLQEVVPETVPILREQCRGYQVIVGGERAYFTAMLLRTGHIQHEETTIMPFNNSRMLRNLLSVKCTIKGVRLLLITSHLESTEPAYAERKRQLVASFDRMREADANRTVIFGGDLNLLDEELVQVGGIPEGLLDVWEATGSNPNTRFTWDSRWNDNLYVGGNSRKRLDRLYMRHSKPSKCVRPVAFELVGTDRLPCGQFPSDHWGLFTQFEKVDSARYR